MEKHNRKKIYGPGTQDASELKKLRKIYEAGIDVGYGLGLTMLLSFLSSKGKQSVSGGDYKSVLVMDQYGNTYSVMVPQAVIEGGISGELGAGAAILGMTGGKGDSGTKRIDDILEGATETTNNAGKARNFEKTGGFEKTLEDFNSLNPSNVKDIQTKYGPGKVGTLSDGTTVVARPGSTTGGPTLEITVSNNKIYKIRY